MWFSYVQKASVNRAECSHFCSLNVNYAGPVTNLLMVPEGYTFGHCKDHETNIHKGRALYAPFSGLTKSSVGESSVPGDPVVRLCASASRNGENHEVRMYSASCLDKQLLELKVRQCDFAF